MCIYKHDCDDSSKNISKSEKYCEAMDKDDVGATDIGQLIVSNIFRATGKRPHFIVNRIHRAKVRNHAFLLFCFISCPPWVKIVKMRFRTRELL